MAVTPRDYAKLYTNLTVAFADGGAAHGTVDQYPTTLGVIDTAGDSLLHDTRVFFQKEQAKKSDFTLDLLVNGQNVPFDKWDNLQAHLKLPFWGKGSPEDCQIAGQVAVLMKHSSRDKLPHYCSEHMTLDCNGFVGNYLWYGRLGNSWDTQPGSKDVGPNSLITEIIFKTQPVANIKDIPSAALNIFALVDKDHAYRVVPGGGSASSAGHITISQPGEVTQHSFVFNSFGGLDPKQPDIYGNFGLRVVEATGINKHTGKRVGLTEHWCAITMPPGASISVPDHTGFKVFKIFRGSKGQWDYFTIGTLPLSAT